MTSQQDTELERFHPGYCDKYEVLRGIYPNNRRLTGQECSCGFEQALTSWKDKEVKSALENKQWHFPRAMGKTAYFTEIFLKECKAKKTAEYHHPDYVVMSRMQYKKIQKSLQSQGGKK